MKRFLSPLRRGVLVAAVVLGAGAAVSAPKQDAINLRIAREQYNLVMTADEVTGQDFQVARTPGGLRGRTYLGVVDVKLKDGEVRGSLGSALVNLKVKRDGDTLEAEGGFGGRPASVKLTPDEMKIYIRDCTYRLKAREPGRSYAGKRSCDMATVPESEVWLPDEFLAASPEEKVTLLLLAL
ncbi:hypothetical protein HUA74_28515 [Myxococcus sp. CA051A]|uniref:Uncharacterized protein n=1 Tax=Myxococcus llanfairpwllgwyngyllgogerychwyrndrobwllllantysiliogogogochensis TaxID=2590453 RepID=A0A540X0N8_9BACT|nr:MULTISPECIES: hypothetical protein [Myxococcus]NTX05513.1 hypothetical protein [Myxococcus sp. CA040A]NTX10134.1 hypothetical protein [Myxococcus sp. CA056]NTX41544.1 hypothetical protein [Myxococcus sp. CA033]NTX55933.1 hypothetical protein [Myxococcus sp. CA039A]NTX64598.1 hypothetical protein [Myxococcus sp. CA051A]